MAPTQPLDVGILLYPNAQLSAVLGLTDLFETANRLAEERGGVSSQIRVRQCPAAEVHTAQPTPFTALILPPMLGGELNPHGRDSLAAWVRDRHAEGTIVCSVCAGAVVLAATGLLSGRRATTHWALAERFLEQFPDVRLDTNKLLIDEGDVITAGGLMAWVDLGLLLVDRFLGPSVMLAVARFFLVDPGGREQRFYRCFSLKLTHGDAAVLRTQHWLHAKSAEKLTLSMMAAEAGLGERTFLRRFRGATGLAPTAYLQQLRVGKARDLLELSAINLTEVAWQVGYEDPAAFRKVFQRIMGLSPGEYRRRFTGRTRGKGA